MYYARDLFVKKGPLGTIWLAGNLLKKVSKHAILTCNVTSLCSTVQTPTVPLALPTQSTLLRGVVRIENRKAVYLLEDALEARVRLRTQQAAQLDRQQLRRAAAAGELQTAPAERLSARRDAITLQEADVTELQAVQHDLDLLDEARLLEARLAFEASAERESIDVSQQRRRYSAREHLFTARPEELSLSEIAMGDSELLGFDRDLAPAGAAAAAMEGDIFELPLTQEEAADQAAIDIDIDVPLPAALSPTTTATAAARGAELGVSQLEVEELQARADRAEEDARRAQEDAEAVLESTREQERQAAATRRAAAKRKRRKRTIRIIVDEHTSLPDAVIRDSLADTSDIVTQRPNMPPRELQRLAQEELFVDAPVAAPWAVEDRELRFAQSLLDEYRATIRLRVPPIEAEEAESARAEAEAARRAAAPPTPAEIERARAQAAAAAEAEWPMAGDEYPFDLESLATGRVTGVTETTAELERERRKRESEAEQQRLSRSYLGRELEPSFLVEQERREEKERKRRSPRISVTELATPDYARPSADFSVPEESDRLRMAEEERSAEQLFEKGAVSRLTLMFRRELQRQLDALETKGEEVQIEFDAFLQRILASKRVSRRDRGISFFQLLVLQSLGIVETEQLKAYGDILISKGARYEHEFSQIQ